MKTVRNNVFETNSSSTHSITIKQKEHRLKKIPRNSDEIFEVKPFENPMADGDEIYPEVFNYTSEISKLSYITHLIVSYLDNYENYDQFDERLRDYDLTVFTSEDKINLANKLFSCKQFTWLKELVKDKTGTEIEFDKREFKDWPFWQTIYDINKSEAEILDTDLENEEEFKKNISEIIFNDNIVIEDADMPYFDLTDEDNCYKEI